MVRGGVQPDCSEFLAEGYTFQFPWCVGEFNERPGATAQDNGISIPVVRGGVQLIPSHCRHKSPWISIPVVRGGVQRITFKKLAPLG